MTSPPKASADLLVLGAGGMAREVFETLCALGLKSRVSAFVEQRSHRSAHREIAHRPVLTDTALRRADPSAVVLAGGIGSPVRKNWFSKLESDGFDFGRFVHPTASIGIGVRVSAGAYVGPGAVVTSHAMLGSHVILNIGTTVSHDVRLGDYVTVCPGVSIGGWSQIGESSWIGIGATVMDRIRIGPRCFIGAGSVVTRDIARDTLAYGVPAKPIRRITQTEWNRLV